MRFKRRTLGEGALKTILRHAGAGHIARLDHTRTSFPSGPGILASGTLCCFAYFVSQVIFKLRAKLARELKNEDRCEYRNGCCSG